VRRAIAAACLAGVAACATPAQVQQVETQVNVLRADSRRSDSASAAQLRQILVLQQQLMDSLAATRRSLNEMKGSTANDMLAVQQQLLQLQELTGQSQRRLTELRSQLEARGGESVGGASVPLVPGAQPDSGGAPPAASASAQQMYDASLSQLRRGSAATGRAGLREMLQAYPKSELVPDALYFVGQSFSSENPDSAASYYRKVVKEYPTSSRAPAALYGLGLLAERHGDKAEARDAYNQLLKSYPKSDEAALARDRLKAIGR
jgi:tol-pal system protein YbgF